MFLVRLFIDPLEKLQTYVKYKVYDKYAALLEKLFVFKRDALGVALYSTMSAVCLSVMFSISRSTISSTLMLESTAQIEATLLGCTYFAKMHRMVIKQIMHILIQLLTISS